MKVVPANPRCEVCNRLKSEHVMEPDASNGFLCCDPNKSRRDRTRFRRAPEDMPGLGIAPAVRVPLGSYLHIASGERYEVIGSTLMASSHLDQVHVLYQGVKHPYLATRPIQAFSVSFKQISN